MQIKSYAAAGYDGNIVSVEADLRRSIPGFDLVGLPDGAVKESRERVRIAVRNSGFIFPSERILINLSPAGIRKEGAVFDLPIAIAVLAASGQIPGIRKNGKPLPVLIMGELNLSGSVCPVPGILPAVMAALRNKIACIVVPVRNTAEAMSIRSGRVFAVKSLVHAADILRALAAGDKVPAVHGQGREASAEEPSEPILHPASADMREVRGQPVLRRAVEVAAAGGHHLFLFGPPGSGKTMTARRYSGLLPDLSRTESIEVTKIHSLAGRLKSGSGLIIRPPFRAPHHSASQEGLLGGGKHLLPGEISLAHKGVLFLDETPEFRKDLLQGLREPVEEGRISIVRAGKRYWFPAQFQLILAANPCPCGNLGMPDKVCVCSRKEIEGYWKRISGPLLDRIDIRVPVKPVSPESILGPEEESSTTIGKRVAEAVQIQEERYAELPFSRNAHIPPGLLMRFCITTPTAKNMYIQALSKLGLSSRACHSILKLARTIADLDESEVIKKNHLLEAVQHRRYGDTDFFWTR